MTINNDRLTGLTGKCNVGTILHCTMFLLFNQQSNAVDKIKASPGCCGAGISLLNICYFPS